MPTAGVSLELKAPPHRRASPERGLHISAVAFLRRALPPEVLFWHTPSGERREHKTRIGRDGKPFRYSPEGAKLKAFGTIPGVPDLCLLLPKGQLALIEFKSEAGSMTKEQKEFRAKAMRLGAKFAECRSVDDVEEAVAHWLLPFGLKLRARLS